MLLRLLLLSASLILPAAAQMRKCYSCASSNMQSNYMTKQRGPGNRLNPPKIGLCFTTCIRERTVFDDNCNGDVWILKARASEDCPGLCYKWSQQVNNSGSLSPMTVRGCYQNLYDTRNPTTMREPLHTFCTFSEVSWSKRA
ncbi:hypothetical protein PRIPAC_89904 [Pristionchus pacificus]|uniref:Uncharacterized protein n=1 Tax=Pristionchus pacificus TaxID=54126 RepID=A0A2A6CWI4_PRIPA|nr:hypothetical protein PRIPAC_89904 [Pristionchus pacificus]|eukprot:PDM82381.1 hypothetical protein PRIPAC_36774 [Pristionchus pacificus]